MLLEDLKSVPTKTIDQIAKKHGVDISAIESQLKKGMSVETEHTTSKKEAREIALDHISELPDYYDKLDKVEKNATT